MQSTKRLGPSFFPLFPFLTVAALNQPAIIAFLDFSWLISLLSKGDFSESMTNQAKILIVDDSTDIVEVLADFLEAKGYAIYTAGTGPEALAQIERERPDLVLLDVMMPHMTGYEV